MRESGCELATLFNGSLDGLQRFANATVLCCGLHVFDPDVADYNWPIARRTLPGLDMVLLEWAWRDQGLIVAAGNPYNIRDLADVQNGAVRLVARQEGAGSRLLFEHLLREQHLDPATLHFIAPPMRSETELALAVRDGKADAGFASLLWRVNAGWISCHSTASATTLSFAVGSILSHHFSGFWP